MNVILFDDPRVRLSLLPFTFTRPTAAIRVGILTIAEKWQRWLNSGVSFKTEDYLQKKFPLKTAPSNILINGALCPDENLVEALHQLAPGKYLVKGDMLLAANQPDAEMNAANTIEYGSDFLLIDKPWKIFKENGRELRKDFALVTKGRTSQPINDKHTIVYGAENVFVEDGVTFRAAIINAENGPVYFGKNAIVQEGAIIRGAFAMCEGAHLNMGAKMRGDVTIGPYSKVGGEVSATVIFGYSNKAHDGFLGCSVLGEWCNLGADTNTSNLKNNYESVKLWSHERATFEDTGLQFCGLMMGDHSKCGINTMFNTGTVVDVCSNIFGEGFPRNYIPSFAWGGGGGFTTYRPDKAFETASRAMARRNVEFDVAEKEILTTVFQLTRPTRVWEKQ